MFNFFWMLFRLMNCGCYCRWHDAGTYDVHTKTGGPNGSIRSEEEYSHGSNNGLKIAIDFCGEFFLCFLQSCECYCCVWLLRKMLEYGRYSMV